MNISLHTKPNKPLPFNSILKENKDIFRYKYLAILFGIILFQLTFSNHIYSQPTNGTMELLSIKEGIDGLEVNNFFIDKDKSLWVSTDNCLNICSSNNVANIYNGKTEHNISSTSALSQFIEHENHIDIFYVNELSFYNRYHKTTKTFTKIIIDSNLIESNAKYIDYLNEKDQIFQIYQEKKTLYIINIYDKKTKKIILDEQIKIIKIINKLDGYFILDDRNNLYDIGQNDSKALLIRRNSKEIPFLKKGKQIPQNLQIFHLDQKENLWLSTIGNAGVWVKKKNANTLEKCNKLPQNELYTWVSEDKTGKLLFGSTDRYGFTLKYYILDNGKMAKWDYLATKFIIPKKIISDDFYKRIYVSTYRNVIILNFTNNDFIINNYVNKNVHNDQGAYGNIIFGISQLNDNSLYISSEFPFVSQYQADINNILDTFYLSDKKLSLIISQYSPKEDKVWNLVKNYEEDTSSVLKFDYHRQKYEKIDIQSNIISFTKNESDNFFLGIKEKGQYRIILKDPMSNSILDQKNISFKPYYMILDDLDQSLWVIDYSNGLYHFPIKDNLDSIVKLDLEITDATQYHCINNGSKQRIYISTNRGLYIVDKKTNSIVNHLTNDENLSTNSITAVLEDHKENLWISTFSGLNLYYPDIGIMHSYFVKDGLPNDEFNTRSYLKENNRLHFGNSNGLVSIDLQKFYKKSFFISIENISCFINNDKTNCESNELIKIHKDKKNGIAINVKTDEWNNRSKIKYYYKLLPLSNEWIGQYNNHIKVRYLNKGEYQLSIIAVNAEGVRSNEIKISVKVFEYWYENIYFITILSILLLSGLILSLIQYFQKTKRNKENSKLQFEKRVSQLELEVLQAQMNPHFIFNSICAIQSSINNGEKELVAKYLNDFASLMRLFLESSKNKALSLKDEIRLITLYMDLEKLRFGNKINFEINIDSNIDVQFTRIPTMILQPFIENAINHGLFHKKGPGNLLIEFKELSDESIRVSIIDDGIGRAKALEIRKNSLQNYKSRALQIIEERVEILKKLDEFELDVKIEDRYDNNNNPIGTAVYIIFSS